MFPRNGTGIRPRRTIAAALFAAVASAVSAQAVVPPFTESFDGPGPFPEFEFSTSCPGVGRIAASASAAIQPLSPAGGACLAFDVAIPGVLAVQEAAITVDLLAAGGGVLRYFAKETSDEDDPGFDGVFLRPSPNDPLVQIVDHTTLGGQWVEISVDLVVAVLAAGYVPGPAARIVFRQKDNQPAPADGLQIDQVRIDAPPPPDTGQANRNLAGLVVAGALNLAAQPPLDTLPGPFFIFAPPGTPLALTIRGAPNRPWILIAGPLNRNALVRPVLGSIDLGFAVGDLLTGFVPILDGTSPGFLNQLAWTTAAGISNVVLPSPQLPGGTTFVLQAAVFDGVDFLATAATEILL